MCVCAAVIERTRDVKEVIRREAFLWLANKCSIRHLTIEERIQVGWNFNFFINKAAEKGAAIYSTKLTL